MGCFRFYCVQVKETCHKIYGFLEFVLSSSKWEREQLSQFWLILLLLSVSFTSNWAKKKSRLVWCNSLGEMSCWYLPADNCGGDGTVNCLHCPGLTCFDILLLSYLDNILRSVLFTLPEQEPWQGAQGNKIINSVSSVSHILTSGGSPDHQSILHWFRVEGWRETWWVPLSSVVTYSMTALGGMMVANIILYLSHALVKFEDPKK